MAATNSALAAGGHQVPEWVGRNAKIFQAQRGADPSKRPRSFEGTLLEQKQVYLSSNVEGAARVSAVLSEEDGRGSIDPPAVLPPASYYQDVKNHANIAATMLVTARRQGGFEPSLAGEEVSAQEMDEFVTKFDKWMIQLNNSYWRYLDVKITLRSPLLFHSGDENLIGQDVSSFVASFRGLASEVVERWRQSLTSTVKAASSYVNQPGGNVRAVSFQMDILDTSGNSNLVFPISFGRTFQSNPLAGKCDSVLTSGLTYRVDSNAIIADADYFAQNGITIFGARRYRDYIVNGR